MGEYYIDQYRDHYAIFDSMGQVQTQYDTHAEAKADLDSYNKTGKPLPEAASKDSIIDKAFKGAVNSKFDTSSKEFKKVGNDVGNDKKAKQTWWNDMKLTARMHKKPYPKVNGYTNGDFKPNHEWLMAAIDQCKSVADCECLIKDAYLGISQDKQLVKNLRAVKEGNPSRYVNVKLVQKWLDNGVTPEKVEEHIEWMKENYVKGLQVKKKEFKKSQNESVNDDSMNEGVFAAINIGFWGFVGLCCIISGILDKKHGKEVKANLTDAEFKAIKNDTLTVAKSLIAAQKSSPFYNDIYKYNRITQDSYKDMIDNFNKGNLYSCTVRFFDAENFENYKSYYKKYGEWGDSNPNWEKLEKSVNVDMVKIIESLGFDIKTGKSSKYPNCEVRVADGEVVYVYPKAPDDILERGKKSKKKMNEDHSEISNDPEMEKLLALAGCTIEDLDTINSEEDIELDDDDPIDANTSREIDAVMDESAVDDIQKDINSYESDINITLSTAKKYIKEAKSYVDRIGNKKLTGTTGKNIADKANEDFNNKCDNLFNDMADSLHKNRISRENHNNLIHNFAYNSSKLTDQQKDLYRKLDGKTSGKYFAEYKAVVSELNKIAISIQVIGDQYNAENADETIYNFSQLNSVVEQNNKMREILNKFAYSMDALQKIIGKSKTRMLFGKYIKDVVNESVDDLDYLMESIFIDIDH